MPKQLSQEQFLQMLAERNPGKFDTSKVEYKNSYTNIELKCLVCNTTFFPQPQAVISKARTPSGCPKCGYERTHAAVRGTGKSPEDWVLRFKEVHGDKYTYDFSKYQGVHSKIDITCPHSNHGVFSQKVSSHYFHKHGCPKCGLLKRAESKKIGFEECVARSKAVHQDKYVYEESGYSYAKIPMRIHCNRCGKDFSQSPHDHWEGHGCPHCFFLESKGEKEIRAFIESLGLETYPGSYKLPSTQHIDVFIPSLNIGIEYNGLVWHSSKHKKDRCYHLRKTQEAESQGIRLVHVFEDDWVYQRPKIETLLINLTHKQTEKYSARSLISSETTWIDIQEFLEKYHIQGAGPNGGICYKLSDSSGNTLAAMVFHSKDRQSEDGLELSRFCCKGLVRGAFSKLLKDFLLKYSKDYTHITSFSDLSWSQGDVYLKSGFKQVRFVRPDYKYVVGNRRLHKWGFSLKHLSRILENFDPSLSESKNCEMAGYYQIWDCGKIKWRLDLE